MEVQPGEAATVELKPPPKPARTGAAGMSKSEGNIGAPARAQRSPGLWGAISMRLPQRPAGVQERQEAAALRRSTQTSSDLERGLLDALECPACFEYMVPPIYMCGAGHSVCEQCSGRGAAPCRACGAPLAGARNLALERLARASRYPCAHAGRGCTLRLAPEALRAHEAACAWRALPCPLACGWRGRRLHLRHHCELGHPERASAVADDAPVLSVQWRLTQKACFQDYRHAVFAFGEAFAYVRRFSEQRRRMLVAVQLLGDPALVTHFRYKFKMVKDGSHHESMSLTRAVHSCDEDLETMFLMDTCISVPFETLVYYGNGPRSFKITKVKPDESEKTKLIKIAS